MSKLQTTTNYEMFQLLDFNRDVNKTKALEQSMKKEGFIPAYPLHVVKDGSVYRVKAGHHRLTVAAKLGIPVVYVVCEDNANIHDLEAATVRWGVSDYLVSYCRLGDPDYLAVQTFHRLTGMPLGCCISLMAGEVSSSSNHLDRFKSGEYKVKHGNKANVVSEIVNVMQKCGAEWATSQNLLSSLSRIVISEKADITRLINKIKAHPQLLKKQPSSKDYSEMFELIYNNHSSKKIPLTFEVNAAMIERQSKILGRS